MLLSLFHGFVVVVNSYTMWYDQQYLELPFPAKGYEELPCKGRFMFFTLWCLTLQTVYFSISLLNDFIGTNEEAPLKIPWIRKLKDCVFSLAFPTALYVTILFWTIYSYDKELIYPDFVESIVPFWLNAVLHIFVAVFITIELLVSKISYPPKTVGFAMLAVLNFGYLVWMHILHERTGKWPYPLFEDQSLPTRVVFLVTCAVLDLGLYVLGEQVSSMGRLKVRSQFNGVANGVHKKSY